MSVENGHSSDRKKYPANQAHPPRGDAPVLYIHPAKQGIDFNANQELMGRPYGLMPVGLPALANLLIEHVIRVRGVIYPLERQLHPDFDLKRWLLSFAKPRVILIDLHWYEHCYGAVEMAKFCRQVLPDAWTVLGGLSASGFAGEILAQFPEVDFIVRGDAEQPLLDLLPQLIAAEGHFAAGLNLSSIANLSYRQGDQVVENPCTYCAASADLDRLNFADIDFIDHKKEYYVHEYIVADLKKSRLALETNPYWGRWITTARGCKHECSYCGGCKSAHKKLANRDGVIPRSPARVIDDLARLKQAGVVQASLTYDIAELGDAYWQEFFARLRSSGIKIGIYNEFFQSPKPAFIDDFARSVDLAHSCVAFSPLSGSERVRRLNGKLYTNDELFDRLGRLNRYNAYVFIYFSLNLPGEDEQTLAQTIDLAEEIYQYYPSSLLKILDTNHTLDPLSPMALAPEKFGIQTSMASFMDYYNYCRNTGLNTPEARTERYRGFQLKAPQERTLANMADMWDKAQQGRDSSWWPVPPGW